MTSGYFVAISSAFFGALLGAFAKQVIDYFIKRSDRREKVRDARTDLLISTIFEIRDLACKYWADSDIGVETIVRESQIVGKLEYVPQLYGDLFTSHINEKRICDTRFNAFKKSIQGDEFQVRGRSANPQKTMEIELLSHSLVGFIQVERSKMKSSLF